MVLVSVSIHEARVSSTFFGGLNASRRWKLKKILILENIKSNELSLVFSKIVSKGLCCDKVWGISIFPSCTPIRGIYRKSLLSICVSRCDWASSCKRPSRRRPPVVRLGWFSNRTGTSVADGKARGKDTTSGAQFAALPLVKPVVWFARAVVNWLSVLLLNQPIIVSEQSTHFGWSLTGGSIVVERIVVKCFVGKFRFISCSHLTFHSCLESFVSWSVCRSRIICICIDRF